MLYIGVDLGTSAVKLLMMDSGGKDPEDRVQRVSPVFPTSGLV